MPRLFISHSSKDNVGALAFQRWLVGNGWAEEDVFIDLHGIGAGERWRDTLRKANASCEAVLLLASPDSLDSKECLREINLAEDLGKEIIVALLRDLSPSDPRLARWADRQMVDLSAEPTERLETLEHDCRVHRVEFSAKALASIKARLAYLGIAPGSFAWVPKTRDAGPYPGLAAFDEADAGIFFGREADIMAGLTKLRLMRRRRSPRLLVIQSASGAGKSSFLRAGLWPRLKRDPDYAPLGIVRPALGLITGPEGVGRSIAPFFQTYGKTKAPGDINMRLMKPGAEAAIVLASLMSEATALAAAVRRAGAPDERPPAPLLAIDQGEEMFAVEHSAESIRFLDLLAAVLKEPPPDVDPYVLVTIRADSVEALLQRWPALGLEPPESLYLPPLSPSAYRDVIVKPAQIFSERQRKLEVEPALVDQLARDATGADALPLLAFSLEKLFHEFGPDGKLTLERYQGLGGVGGSIDRALAVAQKQAGPVGTTENLKRLVVPGLATWDPAAGAAKRIVANEADLTGGSRASLGPLADAMVANRLLTRGQGTLEVAHEALLRRPLLAGWLEGQKDALKLRDDALKEAKDWADGGKHAEGLVRRGARLEAAEALAKDADFGAAMASAVAYLVACRGAEDAVRIGARRRRAAIYTLMLGVIAALTAVIFKEPLLQQYDWYVRTQLVYARTHVWPFLKTAAQEAALKPGETIRDCSPVADICQDLIVLPKGEYWMGSPDGQGYNSERPRHKVKIDYTLAVAKFDVTWEAWDRCVDLGGCSKVPIDQGIGHKGYPLINVTWFEAKQYADWWSRVTGKPYRLLTEAEWEYAARGVTSVETPHPAYFWGDSAEDICKRANGADKSMVARGHTAQGGQAAECDDGYANTSPVGKFPPNAFGLFDMSGNVFQWVEDGWHANYDGNPPANGRVWEGGSPSNRVVRGGAWSSIPTSHRSASRLKILPEYRGSFVGFRLARTLLPP